MLLLFVHHIICGCCTFKVSEELQYHCIVSNLLCSIYLENWFTNHNGLSSIFLFSDDIDMEHAPDRAKDTYSKNLRTHIFSNKNFLSATGLTSTEDLGTHSLRKYPATYASRTDCSLNSIEVRGRWKPDTNRIVTTYVDVKQEYLDAKVQAALCVGGPILSCIFRFPITILRDRNRNRKP